MKNFAIASRAFGDGFSRSGLFGWANLPGGAETLVEQTTGLSESQFAELLMPFSKMKPTFTEMIAPFPMTEDAAETEGAESAK